MNRQQQIAAIVSTMAEHRLENGECARKTNTCGWRGSPTELAGHVAERIASRLGLSEQRIAAIVDTMAQHRLENGGVCSLSDNTCGWRGPLSQHAAHVAERIASRLGL